MNLDVWGLGHAGLVCASGMAHQGHHVVGVDIDPEKVASLNAGETYFRERGLSTRVAATVASGRLAGVTPDSLGAAMSHASFLCLPTPPTGDGKLDTRFILAAVSTLAERLRTASSFHTVIVRSTVPVHFTRGELRHALEARSGKKAGIDFGLAMVPEFLREGHALADFDDPSLIVLGTDDPASRNAIEPLFRHDRCPAQHVSTGIAEFFKLANNAFHSLKIGFANEVARVAHYQKIDGHQVLRLLCQDARLNISSAYLEPGLAFGGACLEKDLSALQSLAAPLEAPLLEAISTSNRAHLGACLRALQTRPYRRLGFYGISNKAGSDDLRHSPALALIDALRAPAGTLWVCDPDLGDDHASFLHNEYGATLVADLASLTKEVDLVVNFRRQALSLPPDFPQIHFASFWHGDVANANAPGTVENADLRHEQSHPPERSPS
jgi:GDP-mannose 6-dehydrogenase